MIVQITNDRYHGRMEICSIGARDLGNGYFRVIIVNRGSRNNSHHYVDVVHDGKFLMLETYRDKVKVS